jgi:hypothetical protein
MADAQVLGTCTFGCPGSIPGGSINSMETKMKEIKKHHLVEELVAWLKLSDIPGIIYGRVPFTYHHDFVRGNEMTSTGNSITRADVARDIQKIQNKFGDDLYYNHLILGCIYQLMRNNLTAFMKAFCELDAFNVFVMEVVETNDNLPEEFSNFEYGGESEES